MDDGPAARSQSRQIEWTRNADRPESKLVTAREARGLVQGLIRGLALLGSP